jgi:hypothetical protein
MTDGQGAELDRPNAARIYDYLLGGAQNFTADRATAEHVLDNYPDAALAARQPRLSAPRRRLPGRPGHRPIPRHRLRRSSNPTIARPRARIAALFEGLDVVEPGIVQTPLWRPDAAHDPLADEPVRAGILAGVGRKL